MIMKRNWMIISVSVIGVFLIAGGVFAWQMGDRILPGTQIGSVPVGGLTRDEAAVRLQETVDRISRDGSRLVVGETTQIIDPDTIGFDVNVSEAVAAAYRRGREGALFRRIAERLTSLWASTVLEAPARVDDAALRTQVAVVADLTTVDRRDIRLAISGTRVRLMTDTAPGRAIDQQDAAARLSTALRFLNGAPIALILHNDPPQADRASAEDAVIIAQRMLAQPLVLQYEDLRFVISREKIGSWIVNEYEGTRLRAGLDRNKIAAYATTVAAGVNIASEPARVITEGGRITGFATSRTGRAVRESELIAAIVDAITGRAAGQPAVPLTIPVTASTLTPVGLENIEGVTELIGQATTPFTGSPRNRIANIKNGVKFLSGTIVRPGDEFSTLGTLGIIDNTSGYLPELVIKGDRTTPEFGGGLCQVSTTLFRAVLNAGLPVTARRNHSYRVGYYEKDGVGNIIGPGLDATIYEPDVDFRFRNDTATPVLIIGSVVGDKVTFQLFGTKDGRTAQVQGPKLLTETPSGNPVYIDEPTLPKGVTKQVEQPHPGGSATAIYTITYADGTVATKEFKSWYRPWPTKFLIGTGPVAVVE